MTTPQWNRCVNDKFLILAGLFTQRVTNSQRKAQRDELQVFLESVGHCPKIVNEWEKDQVFLDALAQMLEGRNLGKFPPPSRKELMWKLQLLYESWVLLLNRL
jgi:hypothetical protein